jgi:hypothetical protein
MSALLVGYARCSTDQQDLTAQRDALLGLGVEPDRIYVDHGLTGTNRERPGLREALAACRAGDTLVVTKLDRLARSPPDARAIADELTTRQISLSLERSVYDPTDAVSRLLHRLPRHRAATPRSASRPRRSHDPALIPATRRRVSRIPNPRGIPTPRRAPCGLRTVLGSACGTSGYAELRAFVASRGRCAQVTSDCVMRAAPAARA